VVLQTGENRLESVCRDPWGDPANRMHWEALVEKFTHLTRGVFPKSRQAGIIAAVQALPVRGSASLQELLASPVSSTFASRGNS
jgi:2-methylcitrate dehydratase PrpD